MTRQVLIVVGAALLSIGGVGLIVGVVWLVSSKVLGTLPYILEARFATLLYLLPAMFLVAAIVGGTFMASALALGQKPPHTSRNLHLHSRSHG